MAATYEDLTIEELRAAVQQARLDVRDARKTHRAGATKAAEARLAAAYAEMVRRR
jgi:hypothetical protein